MFCIRGVAIACNLQEESHPPALDHQNHSRKDSIEGKERKKEKREKETRYHTATGGTFSSNSFS